MSETLGDNPALAGILGEIKEGIGLAESFEDGDRAAEEEIRAFRDGVPPPRLTPLTVGRRGTLQELGVRIDAAARGQRPGLTLIEVGVGDGLSHTLNWAREQGRSLDVAVAELDQASIRVSPSTMQAQLLSATRVGGRSLSEALYSGRVEFARETFAAVRALGGELNAGGMSTVTGLLEATASGRTADAIAILGWMQGETLDRGDRLRLGLHADPRIGETSGSVVSAITYVVRAFGARGLLMLLDARPAVTDLDFLAGLPYSLVVTGGSTGVGKAKSLHCAPLEEGDLVDLARRIRDRHLRAYQWRNASAVTNAKLMAALPLDRRVTARAWVRAVVAALDALLEQDGVS